MTSPQSKYSTGKRRYRAPGTRYPSEYDSCPECGHYKAVKSAVCQACTFSRDPIYQPEDPAIRHLPLTQGYYAVVPTIDYARIIAHSRRWHTDISYNDDGSVKSIYATCHVQKDGVSRKYRLHRFILGVTDKRIQVDHKDRDGLNCRRDNLRLATASQQVANTGLSRANTSGYKGVHWGKHVNKWVVDIGFEGKRRYLGCFHKDDIIGAARAYDKAAYEQWGEYACLNFSGGESVEK